MTDAQQKTINATIALLNNLLKYADLNKSYELAVKNDINNLTKLISPQK